MTIQEVYDYFGSSYQLTKQVGFSPRTPPSWKKKGFVPWLSQLRIEKYTAGKLVFRPEDLPSQAIHP